MYIFFIKEHKAYHFTSANQMAVSNPHFQVNTFYFSSINTVPANLHQTKVYISIMFCLFASTTLLSLMLLE